MQYFCFSFKKKKVFVPWADVVGISTLILNLLQFFPGSIKKKKKKDVNYWKFLYYLKFS